MASVVSALLSALAPPPHLKATFVQPDFSGSGFVPSQPCQADFDAAAEAQTEARAQANARPAQLEDRAAALSGEMAKYRSKSVPELTQNAKPPEGFKTTGALDGFCADTQTDDDLTEAFEGLTIETTLFHLIRAAQICGQEITRHDLQVQHDFSGAEIDRHWPAARRRFDAWWRARAEERGDVITSQASADTSLDGPKGSPGFASSPSP